METSCKSCVKSPLTGPVSVFMLFYLGEKRDSHGRPDLDNLVKAVKDAMTGVVYRDDSQIVELLAKKKPGKEQIKIVVQELN